MINHTWQWNLQLQAASKCPKLLCPMGPGCASQSAVTDLQCALRMTNESKENLDYPRAAARSLTDQEADYLYLLWYAVPAWSDRGKATGSSPEGRLLALHISALICSGVSLREITEVLPLKYQRVAQLSAAGSASRRKTQNLAGLEKDPPTHNSLPGQR